MYKMYVQCVHVFKTYLKFIKEISADNAVKF